jgi:hypothetical protein
MRYTVDPGVTFKEMLRVANLWPVPAGKQVLLNAMDGYSYGTTLRRGDYIIVQNVQDTPSVFTFNVYIVRDDGANSVVSIEEGRTVRELFMAIGIGQDLLSKFRPMVNGSVIGLSEKLYPDMAINMVRIKTSGWRIHAQKQPAKPLTAKQLREAQAAAAAAKRLGIKDTPADREELRNIFRNESLKYHPDLGGSVALMQELSIWFSYWKDNLR